jgi:uncharacterized protein with von Willebrand factor type A (vWA) domain
MKLDQLPLIEIFNSLRQRHGFPLGIEEYLVVVRSLQAGFGQSSREQLEQLCCTLWAKSPEESRLIRRLFEQMWMQVKNYIPHELESEGLETLIAEPSISKSPESLPPQFETSSERQTSNEEMSPSELPDEPPPNLEESPSLTLEMDEPVQVVKAVRSSQCDSAFKRPYYSLLTEYFPVTKRQMKQSWRYLRRLVREGVPTELDVEGTVKKMGREGILLEPVLMPQRFNRTDLVLMIDQEGSMVPFHALSRQLLETAERGGRLRQTRVFYFHDYVNEYLYRHPALLNAQPFDEVLAEVGERAVVMIVSDGGAARGNFDSERVKQTLAWIEQLQQSVRYVAWLNPMPSESWLHTTAAEIAGILPMFEMSRLGMNKAISVLRGRYVACERMYEWLV